MKLELTIAAIVAPLVIVLAQVRPGPTVPKAVAVPSQPVLVVESYKVADADTLTDCEISFGWDLTWHGRSIRFRGFDAKEVSKHRIGAQPPVTDREIVEGKADRDKLAGWLATGKVFVRCQGFSTDGRRLQGDIIKWDPVTQKWEEAVPWMRANNIQERPKPK